MTALARISFWLDPERLGAFTGVHQQRLAPVLERHGLAGSDEGGRPTAPGVFSQLLVLEQPAAVAVAREALERDPAWAAALQAGGEEIGSALLPWALDLYRVPAGPGQTVAVGPGLRQGLWQSFGVDDGLPVHSTGAIHLDRQGNLWIASYGEGVCRYDGSWVTTFTVADGLADEAVGALGEDSQGRIWCGTQRGVSCYDDETWVTYTAADGLADSSVGALLVDRQGRVWCGTAKGLSCHDGEVWITYTTADGLADNGILGLAEGHQGRLWCGTRRGVSGFDGAAWVTYTTADGLAHDWVSAIIQDRQGRLWCGSWGGLSCYDGQRWCTASRCGELPDSALAIAEDREGRLWFGTHGSGLYRYDGERTTRFTVVDGLGNDMVESLGLDQAGDLWVGSSTGMSRYCQTQFLTWTAADGLAAEGVFGIGEDRQGWIWLGTSKGRMSRWDGAGWTTLELPPAAGTDSVWAIREDRRGRVWVGTIDGLFSYDGQQFTCTAQGPGQGCRALLEDRAGRLWAGAGMTWGDQSPGLRQYDGKTWTTFTTGDGLASDLTCALMEDRQGRLWVGGGCGGLSVHDGRSFTALEGLPPQTVAAIAEDRDGRLWVAVWGGGVWRWDSQAFAPLAAGGRAVYPLASSLLADRDGRLWIGTWGGGVYLYDGQVLQRLSRRDGLVHDAVQALFQDRRGDIWIGTEGGVTRYRPLRVPPAVRLLDAIADQRYGSVTDLEIPVSQKLVAFVFEGRSWTTRSEGMAYVYRLQGLDDTWKTAYDGRVEYRDLPLGEYTFQLRAVDRDLNYSKPVAVRLRVAPDPRVAALTQALSGTVDRFVGHSPALQQVQAYLAQVAGTDLTVLILGETGTGKGLAAHTVHRLSHRSGGAFISVNCGALPEGLVESELFGHEKGAFTGAVSRKLGKVEVAQGGTLFLDEIGDLSPAAQTKLLRLLEERTFERVGGTQTLRAEVRVVAATNRDLAGMVAAGQFRQDLYFRLQGFTVWLPPLRQRVEDIPELAVFFAVRMAAHLDKAVDGFAPAALVRLQAYPWPGNVRELESAVKRAVIVAAGRTLQVADLTLQAEPATAGLHDEALSLSPEEYERRYLLQALTQAGWTIKGSQGAAARLGVSPSTLHGRLKKLGISRPEGR